MRSFRGFGLMVLLAASLLGACKMTDQIGEVVGLTMIIQQRFQEPGASVAPANDKHVLVMLKNSKKFDLPDEERKAYARQIAEVVRDNYSRYDKLESVAVAFAKGSDMKPEVQGDPYEFTVAELGPPVPKAPAKK